MPGFSIDDLSYLKENEWVVFRRAYHANIPAGCRIEYNTTDFWYWVSSLPFKIKEGFLTPEDALANLLQTVARSPTVLTRAPQKALSEIEKRRLHNEKVLRDYKIKPKK